MTAAHTQNPSATRWTREQVIRLGQDRAPDAPWTFVPLALRCLHMAPADHAMRFLLAANYARLGLASLAREQCERLNLDVGPTDEVSALLPALAMLPDDRVPVEAALQTARRNAVALAERFDQEHRVPTVLEQFEAWLASQHDTRLFRTAGGEVVRTSAAPADESAPWTLWGNLRAQASESVRQAMPVGSPAREAPFLLEGINPPWLLLEIFSAATTAADGYRPPLNIVCSCLNDVFAAFMLADLRVILLDERVRWFIGSQASKELSAHFQSHRSYVCTGGFAITSSSAVRCDPDPREVLSQAATAASEDLKSSSLRVSSNYERRDAGWWRRRFQQARAGGEPLRVLVPTTRFSTFLKHSSSDLVDAFRSVGVQAQLLIEPDDSMRMGGLAYLRAVEQFDPDLIVSLNFTRANLNTQVCPTHPVLPLNVPFVTWVQDAMPHLFRESTGQNMGPLDFLAGHMHEEFFKKFHFPRGRFLYSPVLASEHKFHPGPIAADLRERFSCEMAMVTHHSQTPEQLAQTLLDRSRNNPSGQRLIQELLPVVREACEQCWQRDTFTRLDEQVNAAVDRCGLPGDPATRSVALNQIARPLADRFIRHQTLHWAADLAERRGWRLHIYGRGWRDHPTLGKHARGEVEHGEDLRACYQAAAVHLHASVNWYLHQRVLECALSGGLPAVRLKQSDMTLIYCHTALSITRDCRPSEIDEEGKQIVPMVDHVLGMRYGQLLQHQGVTIPGRFTYNALGTADPLDLGGLLLNPPDAVWVMGDPVESCYWDRAGLETLVEKAVGRPAWRSNLSRGIAGRVRDNLSFDGFARGIVSMVETQLEALAGAR